VFWSDASRAEAMYIYLRASYRRLNSWSQEEFRRRKGSSGSGYAIECIKHARLLKGYMKAEREVKAKAQIIINVIVRATAATAPRSKGRYAVQQ
jgi:hypothetical protein